jgi:hypothetical protein
MSTEALRRVRQMTPEEKLWAAERLYVSARQLKAAALRAQHPEWSEEAVARAVRDALLYARD